MRRPLKPLHAGETLSKAKLELFERMATDVLTSSLAPGQVGSLKVRPDGTLLDGHHRIHILRLRGVEVDALPREILVRAAVQGEEG